MWRFWVLLATIWSANIYSHLMLRRSTRGVLGDIANLGKRLDVGFGQLGDKLDAMSEEMHQQLAIFEARRKARQS